MAMETSVTTAAVCAASSLSSSGRTACGTQDAFQALHVEQARSRTAQHQTAQTISLRSQVTAAEARQKALHEA